MNVDEIRSVWFLAAVLILAYSALAILSFICSSLRLLIPIEFEQGQLVAELLIFVLPSKWSRCFHAMVLSSQAVALSFI